MLKELFLKCKRLILFCITGCINTLVDFCAFTVSAELLQLSAALSQVIGYAMGLVCSFLLNKNLTFRDGHGAAGRQVLLFILVNAVSLGVSSLLISLLTAASLNKYLAKIIVTLVSMCINYFGYKHLVFQIRNHEEDTDHE